MQVALSHATRRGESVSRTCEGTRLLDRYTPYFHRLGRRFAGFGSLSHMDIVQEARLAFWHAYCSGRMGQGRASLAVLRDVEAAVKGLCLSCQRIVSPDLRPSQVRALPKLRRALRDEAHTAVQLGQHLGLSRQAANQVIRFLLCCDVGLDVAAATVPASSPEDHEPDPQMALHQAVLTLSGREQYIVTTRWLREDRATLRELAAKMGISISRVRALETRALLKLRDQLENVLH